MCGAIRPLHLYAFMAWRSIKAQGQFYLCLDTLVFFNWIYMVKGKGKVKLSLCFNRVPRHEQVLGEWRYSSTHSLTSVLDGGQWSTSRPGALPQGKNPWYPLDRRLGGPQSRSGRGGEDKNSQPPPGIEP
jgi:hypothetical protein